MRAKWKGEPIFGKEYSIRVGKSSWPDSHIMLPEAAQFRPAAFEVFHSSSMGICWSQLEVFLGNTVFKVQQRQ